MITSGTLRGADKAGKGFQELYMTNGQGGSVLGFKSHRKGVASEAPLCLGS